MLAWHVGREPVGVVECECAPCVRIRKQRRRSGGQVGNGIVHPKFSGWGKTVLWQAIDVEPITVFGMFKND